ncbi:Zn-ribbon domain-containing OB-fold protein [Alicycliphilus sp. T452]|jgi:uncharacterized OB-fold protein
MTTTPTSFEHDPFAQAYPEHLAFWQAAEQGRLLLRTCRSCNRPHWYPRVVCPLCGSTDTEWREASGDGTLYAFSVMRRVEQPYAVAYVRLAEGPALLTNIETDQLDSLRIGQPVRLRFRRAEEGRLMPVFAPA